MGNPGALGNCGAQTNSLLEPASSPSSSLSYSNTQRRRGRISFAAGWRIAEFYVGQFATVGYFVNLMVFATVATTLVQALAYRAWGGQADVLIVRCGIIGMWSIAICAAGLVGFERYRGTLVHLINSSAHPLLPLALLVSSGATFGLAAFPLAWVTWIVVAGPAGAVSAGFPLQLMLAAGLSWLGAAPMTWIIAATFVLTPNAIEYEQLLVTPFFILSGILFLARPAPAWMGPLEWATPLGAAVRLIFGTAAGPTGAITPGLKITDEGAACAGSGLGLSDISLTGAALFAGVWIVWAVAAWGSGRWCLKRAIAQGSLAII